MSTTAVYSRTNSVTFVADNILRSLKDIIRLSGLDPSAFAQDWDVYMRGIKAWLESEHLEMVLLEIYHPATNALIRRWDIDVVYSWSGGDGAFWIDTDQIRYAIKKAGIAPSTAKYDLLAKTKPGRPDVAGWTTGQTRSTSGMVRQALGSTVEHSGLGASAAYWRQA